MAITVFDALKLNALKEFRLVAGHMGLDRPVEHCGMLDYEFTGKVPVEMESQFGPGDFILSSLLFADQNEEALYNAVRKLIDLNVSALGVKTIFYKELPEKVKLLADRERFPIFMFENETYFEHVIAQVMEAVRVTDRLNMLEEKLEILMYRDLSLGEIQAMAQELNSDFARYVVVFFGRMTSEVSISEIERIVDLHRQNPYQNPENSILKYKGGLVFFITSPTDSMKGFETKLDDLLAYGGLSAENLRMGRSTCYETAESLSSALREAVWAQRVAEMEAVSLKPFEAAGVYRFLLPHRDSLWMTRYMESIMRPLLQQDETQGTDLVKTAMIYVCCGGSIRKAAERLFVHENTVRYRLNRIHEMVCPQESELVFFEQLAAAVRMYALQNKRGCNFYKDVGASL